MTQIVPCVSDHTYASDQRGKDDLVYILPLSLGPSFLRAALPLPACLVAGLLGLLAVSLSFVSHLLVESPLASHVVLVLVG